MLVWRSASLAAFSLGFAICGCGGSLTASSRTVSSTGAARVHTTSVTSSRLRGDEDNDRGKLAKRGYYDRDDGVRRDFGHAPSPAQALVMTKLVERYFASAAKGDGTGACALMSPSFAAGLPEGRLKTCAEVLSAVFRAGHPRLSAPVKVTDLRVAGRRGLALLGSPTMSARSFYLVRSDKWRIDDLLGAPLP